LLHALRHGLDALTGRQIGNQGLDATACCGRLRCELLQTISAPGDCDHRLPASREHSRKLQADA
jgi:hypothetical protein